MDDGITLMELVNQYVLYRQLRPTSIENYRSVADYFLRTISKRNGLVVEIDTADMIRFRERVLQRAKPVTWNYYQRHLRALFTFAAKMGVINVSPLKNLSMHVELSNFSGKAIDEGQLRKIVKFIKKAPSAPDPCWFWEAVILTLYYSGMRRRQLVGLHWEDLDFPRKSIRLRAEYSKTGQEWTIPMHPAVVDQLVRLHNETASVRHTVKTDDQVFNITYFNRRYAGKTLSANQLSTFFVRLSHKAKVGISAHRLRHSCGTHLLNSDSEQEGVPMSLRAVQHLLGHRSMTTTAGYLHPHLKDLVKLVDRLPKIW